MALLDDVTAIIDVTNVPPEVRSSDCLITIYQRHRASGACRRLGREPVRIGRDPGNDIELDDDGVSRDHARLDRIDELLSLTDLGSTNGTLLNGVELAGTAVLANGDQIKVGSTIFKYLSASDLEGALYEQIHKNAITDYLTQLHNRRHFDECLATESARARRYARPLSLLMIDIDLFKQVNDTHGHQVGDRALAATAAAIRACVREEDIVARYGGEEFVALLPETALEEAFAVASKVLEAVARNEIVARDARFRVTVSIGCSQLNDRDPEAADLVRNADAKMYEAKQRGRNCVRC